MDEARQYVEEDNKTVLNNRQELLENLTHYARLTVSYLIANDIIEAKNWAKRYSALVELMKELEVANQGGLEPC